MKARTKMISYRISAKEYEQFQEFCSARGSASVSELARTAVNRLVRDPAYVPENLLESRLDELEAQLHLLSLELKRVKENNPANGVS
jgi:hypothetical protein